MRRFKRIPAMRMLAAVTVLAAASAGAETLPVSGVYPAQDDAAAQLRTIEIEPFGGADGQTVGILVGDRLRDAGIGGRPYFQILPAGSPARAEAVLQGTAAAELSRREAEPRQKEVCVERNDKDKCVRKEKQKTPCWDVVAHLVPTIRLIGRDGARLYALDEPLEQSQRYCRGEDRPSGEQLVRGLAARLADRVRGDLAPVERADAVRVMESRKGLTKADEGAFKEAVRLTKRDRAAACSAWAALEPRNSAHPSLLFNLGLCAESEGRLEQALDFYRRASAAGGDASYARDGLDRLTQRVRAEAQLKAHGLT
jgi:hypothetical protein